jgi:nicotinamide mononucleotide adenylyltransferase
VVFILPGRHQPPHNDHVEIIRRALARIDGTLHLALIVSPPARGVPQDELEREARRQNDPERTPFSFADRAEMLEASLDRESLARVRIMALPRPETAFELVAAIFPERRTWIVPETEEAFDEMKARFFRERGDQVLRIELAPTTSGRVVRALIRRGELTLLEKHVPSGVVSWLKRRSTCRKLEL